MRLSSLFFVSLIIDCSVWRDLIYTEPLGFGRSKINHIAEDATASRKQRPDVGSYFPRHVCPGHRMTLAIFSSVGKRGSRGIITPTRNLLVSEKSFRLDSIRFFRFFHRQSIFLVLLPPPRVSYFSANKLPIFKSMFAFPSQLRSSIVNDISSLRSYRCLFVD